jgi:ABC-type transport system substrate-binding protein
MTFPGLQLLNNPLDVSGMRNLHSRFVALPANNYAVNNNKSRYSNPQYDAMVDRYFVTIPAAERIQLLGQIIRHIAEDLPTMPVVYNIQPIMIGNRLLNVTVPTIEASETWNPEQWDVKL